MPTKEFWRNLGITFLFLLVFAWYISPVLLVGMAWLKTDGFTLHWSYVKTMGESMKGAALGLEELPRFLTGLLSAAGLSRLLSEQGVARKSAVGFSIFLIVVVVLATSTVLTGYFMLSGLQTDIDQEYGPGLGAALVDMCGRRFRELLTLLAALLGLSTVELLK